MKAFEIRGVLLRFIRWGNKVVYQRNSFDTYWKIVGRAVEELKKRIKDLHPTI
jgi:hypothetical protein